MSYNTINKVSLDYTYDDSSVAGTNKHRVNFDGELSGSVDVGDVLFLHDVKLNFQENAMAGFQNTGYATSTKAFMTARLIEAGEGIDHEGRHFPKIGGLNVDIELGDLSSLTYSVGGDEDDQDRLNSAQDAINEIEFEGFRIKAGNDMGYIYHSAGVENAAVGNNVNWADSATRDYEGSGLMIKLGGYGSLQFARLNGNSSADKKDVSVLKIGKALNDSQNQNDEGFNRHYPEILKNMQIEIINEKAKDNSKRDTIALTWAMDDESSVMISQQENTASGVGGAKTKGNVFGYNKKLNENQLLEARYSTKQFATATDSNQLRVGVVHKF